MREKWTQIQLILGKRLASGQFKAWIASLVPHWEKDGLVLCAQTEFAAAHVRTWYGSLLTEVVGEVLGHGYQVHVRCRPGVTAQIETPTTRPCDRAVPAADLLSGLPLAGELIKSEKAEKKKSGERQQLLLPGGPISGRILPEGEDISTVPDSALSAGFLSTGSGSFSSRPSSENKPAIVERMLPSPRPLSPVHLALPVDMSGARGDGAENSALQEHLWRFSFEDFVVGPCNELAYAASRSMCNASLHSDILFLSSAPGLGKTHLLHAVGQQLCAACNKVRPQVEYLTAEEFASRFYYSLKAQDTDRFKGRYRNADLLLLEDVHFLQNKEKMQAELLATIKALSERGGKVVFSSSFAPRDLKQMDEQLQSRLLSGLVTFIDRPDEETRRRILRRKASLHQVILPEEVEDVLARHIHADIRQIESCLHNLFLKAKLLNTQVTVQMAWEVIGHYAAHSPVLDMEAIMIHVCRAFDLTKEQLHSTSRKQEYVSARHAAFYLARKHTDLSLEAIGRCFNRKHSTVLKGITSLEREISRQTPHGQQLSNILNMIERNGNISAHPVHS